MSEKSPSGLLEALLQGLGDATGQREAKKKAYRKAKAELRRQGWSDGETDHLDFAMDLLARFADATEFFNTACDLAHHHDLLLPAQCSQGALTLLKQSADIVARAQTAAGPAHGAAFGITAFDGMVEEIDGNLERVNKLVTNIETKLALAREVAAQPS